MSLQSCELDPVPTWLLKLCSEDLLPIITHVINLSLSQSVVPGDIKEALLAPLLKKASLDHEVLKHFRPVSNLAFIGKMIEKVVAVQFKDHLIRNKLQELMQSAYRKGHSTETALLRVQNDILQAIDNNKIIMLVLLDLSAAFDTIDHALLLSRLEHRFGVKSKALAWFKSYLSERKQFVTINGVRSSPRNLKYGVPQGSVMGPILFTCYTAPLGEIIERHGLCRHFYADDTQLYIAVKPGSDLVIEEAVTRIQNCISDIAEWMATNFMKLNDGKTEVMVFGAANKIRPQVNVNIRDQDIQPSKSVRNLGVVYDPGLLMDKHITMVSRAANMHIRNIGSIRRYLSPEAAKVLVHSLVISRLDYGNVLLYGLPQTQLSRLQRIQNKAARVITRTPRRDHITPVLYDLHWLPVVWRIKFKVALYAYRCLNELAPMYLQDLVTQYHPTRNLRSEQQNLLTMPKARTVYGHRAFSVAAPFVWNSLPIDLRLAPSLTMFKKNLKTYIFREAYHMMIH